MKRKSLVVVLLAVTAITGLTRSLPNPVPPDSLRNAFLLTTIVEDRLRLAYEISKPYIASKPDTVRLYLFGALKDSALAGNSEHLASCLNMAAVYYHYQGKYDSMVYYARRSARIYVALNDSASAVKPRKNLGIGLRVQGRYEEANGIFFDILDYYKSINDSIYIAATLNDIGNTYSYLQDFETSMNYQFEALRYLETADASELKGNIYNTMGYNVKQLSGRDSSVYYYEKSLEYKLKGGNIYSIITTRNNLCTSIDYKADPDRCIDCFLELINDQLKVGAVNSLARSFINLSVAYDYHNDCSNALSSLDSAEHYLGFSDDLFLKQDFLKHISSTLENCGNIELAYLYQDSLLRLNDSIFDFQKNEALLELDAKYQTRMKADSIQVLEAENTASLLKVENQRWQISFLFILIASIIGAGSTAFYVFRQRQLRQRELEVSRMREEERIRIARDMHDEIGSGLTRISLMGDQLKMQDNLPDQTDTLQGKQGEKALAENETAPNESKATSFSRISDQSRTLSQNLKEIIWAIDPGNDSLEELLFYLRDYINDLFEETEIGTTIHFPEEIPEVVVGSEVRRNLFLLVKEILNNALKYASASEVSVAFELSPSKDGSLAGRPAPAGQKAGSPGWRPVRDTVWFATLSIKDNGNGFNPSEVKSGVGLNSIKTRVKQLGGEFKLDSEDGNGTQYNLKDLKLNTTKV